MEPRVSLVTLGVSDVDRARRFYEALGWEGESPDGEVVFFQAGPMVVALWGRDLLAADSVVDDTGGWGGVTLAHNVSSPAEVDAVLAQARRRRRDRRTGRRRHPVGWVLGRVHRSRRPPVGGGAQPGLDARRRRFDPTCTESPSRSP